MNSQHKGALVRMASGELVERDTLNIALKINEYDHNLRLRYLPPEESNLTSAPYAVFERCPDGLDRLIFYVWELDDRVLDRLRLADTGSNDIMARIDAVNGKIKAESQRRYQDALDEKHDIFKHALASPGHKYSWSKDDGSIATLDDTVGVKVEPRRTKSQSENVTG